MQLKRKDTHVTRLINLGYVFYFCIDPCEGGKACGECAGCRVVNHVAQCSCPANYYGNALISCAKSMIPCDGTCECDEIGFCTKSCYSQDQCSCGEVCHSEKCRIKCDVNNYCPKVPSLENFRSSIFNYNILLLNHLRINSMLFAHNFIKS